LEVQGLVDDGLCICETILMLFPDYLFARATLATAAMRGGDYQYALELLTLLFARREFHISAYNSLRSMLIEYSLLTEITVRRVSGSTHGWDPILIIPNWMFIGNLSKRSMHEGVTL
jgi:hypothetical protein